MIKYFLPVASNFISEQEENFIIHQNSEYLKNLNCEHITPDQLLKVENYAYQYAVLHNII